MIETIHGQEAWDPQMAQVIYFKFKRVSSISLVLDVINVAVKMGDHSEETNTERECFVTPYFERQSASTM